MTFQDEEIALCKKITEKHRKVIEYGDWYFTKGEIRNDADSGYVANEFSKPCLPLWQISDCLEFLYERYEEVGVESLLDYWEASVYLHRKIKDAEVIDAKGKTPLESLLKVVLAILEEK